jgi:hydrogenase nickel incorporation protein HypA/HybF
VHEMGLCDAIVAATLERAAGRPVRRVRVRVGGHPVDPDVISQGFRLAAAGTVAAGADVELVVEPLLVRCLDCGGQAPARDAMLLVACPRCGGVDVEVRGGDRVVIESITTGGPDAAAGKATDVTEVPR